MWEFFRAGGPFMFFLVASSIVGLTYIIERTLALRHDKVIPALLEEALENCRKPEDLPRLQAACHANPSALARLLLVAYDHLDEPREETIELLQTRARQEVSKLERGLVVLEVVVGVAPLLGLVGTIHGLIGMFGDLGKAGLANNAELAKGISIALNTTFMGLIVAIPSLTAWSFFNRRVENLTVELENLCDKFVRQQYRIRTRP